MGIGVLLSFAISLESSYAQPAHTTPHHMELCLSNSANETICTSRFKGKYVLINFWQSTCPDCKKETLQLRMLANEFDNLVIYRVSMDGLITTWKGSIQHTRWPANFINVWCPIKKRMEIVPKHRISVVPYSILLKPDGTIIAKGELTPKQIRRALRR